MQQTVSETLEAIRSSSSQTRDTDQYEVAGGEVCVRCVDVGLIADLLGPGTGEC